jgi:tetratricopeptide (TPR) repeat protein
VAVLAGFAVLTSLRLPVWENDLTMNEDVLATYPENGDAWSRLGLAWSARAEPKREEAAYREGLRHEPRNRYLLKNLGGVLFETGRYEEAREVLSFAFLLGPDDRQKAAIGYNLARTLIELGEWDEAEIVLVKAVECRPPLGVAYDLLGRVRDRLRVR